MDNKNTREITDERTGVTRTLTVHNGGVSDEQIQAWKAEHRKVSAVEVTDGDDLYIGYFKRPDMNTVSAVNKLSKTDEIKGSMTMFDNCWLGGDPAIKADALLKIEATKQLAVMLASVVGSLKNL